MMRAGLAAAVILCLAAASTSAQQIYRWVDERGRVHVTDRPPPPTARDVQKKSYGSAPADGGQTSYELTQAARDFPVRLYTAPGCEPCADARAALNRRGVPFREIPVGDARTADELKRVSGGEQVPVLVVGRSVHTGFLQGAYDALLDAARYPSAGNVPPRAQGEPSAAADPRPAASDDTTATGPYAPGARPQRSQSR